MLKVHRLTGHDPLGAVCDRLARERQLLANHRQNRCQRCRQTSHLPSVPEGAPEILAEELGYDDLHVDGTVGTDRPDLTRLLW